MQPLALEHQGEESCRHDGHSQRDAGLVGREPSLEKSARQFKNTGDVLKPAGISPLTVLREQLGRTKNIEQPGEREERDQRPF